MPSGRGSYERGDLETRWDHYNASRYGRNAGTSRHEARENSGRNSHYANDDYRYGSGNREWHLHRDNSEGRNERIRDRYQSPGRYAGNRSSEGGRDVFERVGSGITNAWDSITGGTRHSRDRDRDDDWHSERDNRERIDRFDYDPDRERAFRERREHDYNRSAQPASGPLQQNIERYGHRPIQGYERAHEIGDNTPQRQQRIGDRDGNSENRSESDFHRAGRNFDRFRNS